MDSQGKIKGRTMGPQTSYGERIHAQKYRGVGEDFREYGNRVAGALTDEPEKFKALRDILLDQRFLPGGRIQAAMGSTRKITAFNCYVSGTIEDTFVDGNGSIMARAVDAAATMRMGGGIGYDFSGLRPRGALIKKLGSLSSGPISFMDVFDAVCRCTASSGHRRGAQMGVLRVDHPDIEEFIRAKQNTTRLTGFNISIAVTDEFMEALAVGGTFNLRWGGQKHREVDAQELWETIMRSTWDWAEPGVLFIDAINRMNNLWYCETISATNPCGEQPLPPFGACLLGSFNLTKYLVQDGMSWAFDWDKFRHDIPHVVEAMDNVTDRTIYPLFEQEKEAHSKRRMGLGVCGLANTLEVLGHPYGSPTFLQHEAAILGFLRDETYRASAMLAKHKQAFPLYRQKEYLQGEFVKTLPEDVRDLIKEHGIRNSHLTSIAPTGTISLAADNVSGGIEPVFSHSYDRTVIEFEGERTETIQDWAYRVHNIKGRKAGELSPEEHLNVLLVAQKYVDSAVSKTCNVGAEVSYQDFKSIYVDAHAGGAKGCTTFRAEGKRGGVLVEKPKDGAAEGMACTVDAVTGSRTCE